MHTRLIAATLLASLTFAASATAEELEGKGNATFQVPSHGSLDMNFSLHHGEHASFFASVEKSAIKDPHAKISCAINGPDVNSAASVGNKCGLHIPNSGETSYHLTITNWDTLPHTITLTWNRTAK